MNGAQFLMSNELYLIGNSGKHNHKADCILTDLAKKTLLSYLVRKKKLMTKQDDKDRDDVADFISYLAVVMTLQCAHKSLLKVLSDQKAAI